MNIIQKFLDSSDYGGTLSKVSSIVLHHSAGSEKSMYSTFDNPNNYVSAHYSVDTDGTIYQYVPDNKVAWHAGVSLWGEMNGLNYYALGVEVVSIDGKTYTEAQRTATRELTSFLLKMHSVSSENIVRHCDITQTDIYRMENKTLSPDKDSEKSCRKWDIGENFFNGVPFAEYRESFYPKPMGPIETIVKNKYDNFDVVNDVEGMLSTTDTREIMSYVLLLSQNEFERNREKIKQIEEIPKAELQSQEIDSIFKPTIKYQYNQNKDFVYNKDDTVYKWRNCTIIACLTAIANQYDTDLLKEEESIMEQLVILDKEMDFTGSNRKLSTAVRIIEEIFSGKIDFATTQLQAFTNPRTGVYSDTADMNIAEGKWAVVAVRREGADHAYCITKKNGKLYEVDNYKGEDGNIRDISDERNSVNSQFILI